MDNPASKASKSGWDAGGSSSAGKAASGTRGKGGSRDEAAAVEGSGKTAEVENTADGEAAEGGGEEDEDDEQESEDMSKSSELTASEDETTWITWFCNLKGNNFFCKIDEDYIQDDFNLTGLSALVPYYDYALDMMFDVDIPIDNLNEDQQEMIETAAEVLYGLIHARFILTTRGMQRMYEKFFNVDFGRCPRVYCQGQNVLPVGLSDTPRNFSVNLYCPRCQELYYPRSSKHANLDGAYFGTTFPHLFMLAHPELIPPKSQQAYVPRIYGFRISKESIYYHPRDSNTSSKRRSAQSSSNAGGAATAPVASATGPGGEATTNVQGSAGQQEKDRIRGR